MNHATCAFASAFRKSAWQIHNSSTTWIATCGIHSESGSSALWPGPLVSRKKAACTKSTRPSAPHTRYTWHAFTMSTPKTKGPSTIQSIAFAIIRQNHVPLSSISSQ